MGVFSSKKKTYVYSSPSRMIEDSDIIISNKAAVTEYLLQNTLQTTTTLKEMSLVDHMLQASHNSLPSKWGRAYRNAEAGRYHYGLPKSSVFLQESQELSDVLSSMFTSNEQTAISLIYGHVGQLNYFHMTRFKLVTEHGWNFADNTLPQLSAQFGVPVYLENFQLHYPPEFSEDVVDETFYDQWGISARAGKTHNRAQDLSAEHSIFVENPSALTAFARIYYTYERNGVIQEGTFDIGFDTLDESADYIMASYQVGNQIKFFTGNFGSGEFPEVERVFQTSETIGKFYPRMYARLGHRNLADRSLKETEAYKNCQQFWNAVDVNWSEWVNELHENMEGTGDVSQVYVTCAIPANSTDRESVQYLFKYFERLYNVRTRSKRKYSWWGKDFEADEIDHHVRDGLTIVIEDKAYRQSLSFSGIGKTIETGKIGPVGTYAFDFDTVSNKRPTFSFRRLRTRIHRYKRQVTENSVEVISVYGLSMAEYVRGSKTVVSAGDSDSLLIPLDFSMTSELPNRDYEMVMAKSLHVVVNTVKVVKTKWYQRGIFKAVLFIAAVVMSVWTGGQSLTLYSVFIATIQAIAATVVMSLVAKLAVKLGVSVELVAAVAVVLAIVAGYANITDAEKVMGISAQTLNQATNVALQVQGQMRQLEMQSLFKDMVSFAEDHQARMQELQDLQDALAMDRQILDNALWVSPNTHGVFINLGESPDDYYTRTIHSGNVGVLAIDVTLNSIQQMLQLPKPEFDFYGIQGGIQ